MGHLLPHIIRELVMVMEKLKPKRIIVKGNVSEGILLSKFFRWAKFSHPPIYCMKQLKVPAPDKLSAAVKEKIISLLVRVVCCYEDYHRVDHAKDPRPNRDECPLPYPKQEFNEREARRYRVRHLVRTFRTVQHWNHCIT